MNHPIVSFFSAILSAVVLAGMPAFAAPEKRDFPGVENYTLLEGSPGFAGAPVGFGGATEPSAMASLKDEGFATVINLRLADEPGAEIDRSRAAAQAVELNYIHLPFDSSNPDSALVDKFVAAAGNQSNQPIYVHCGSATRAAALWMIVRVLEDDWDIDAAAKEVESIAGKPADAVAYATAYLSARSTH